MSTTRPNPNLISDEQGEQRRFVKMKSSSITPGIFLQAVLISLSMGFILYTLAWNFFSTKAQHSSPAPTNAQTGKVYHEPQTGAHKHITTWLPTDYELEDTARKCERIFGSSYITSTAARRTSHCPPSSPSRLDCFHAAREPTPHEWPLDTLCLARGVYLSHSAEGAASNIFSIQCPLNDDFGAGQQVDSIKTPKPYFFGTGVTQQLANWTSSRSGKKCSSASIKAEWIILVRRGLTSTLWEIFMEVTQVMISVDILRTALDESGEPYMSDEELSRAQIVFEDNETLPFEELWHLVLRNHKPLVMKKDLEPGCYNNIVLSLPGSSSPIYTALFDGEFHRACRDSFLVRTLRRRVLSYYGFADDSDPFSSPESFPSLNITIIGRKKTRMIWDLESMVDAVRTQHPSHNVNVVDFEELTLREQVQLVSETDILVGVHGSSLTHALLLKPSSAVIELMPPLSTGKLGYVAQLSGAAYFERRTLWPEVWNQTVNGIPLPADWQPPEFDLTGKSRYVYLHPQDFAGLIDAAVRSLWWEPGKPFKVNCVSNECRYTAID